MNMVTKRKPAIRGKIKKEILHICSKEEKIEKMADVVDQVHLWLAGNHDPENGMIFKMIDTIKAVKDIKEDISEIKASLKESITSSSKSIKALELYRAEMNGIETGQKDVIDRDVIAKTLKATTERDRRFIIFQIIALCLTLAGVTIATYFGFKNNRSNNKIESTTTKTEQKVENLGVPYVSNPRGLHIVPSDSIRVKFLLKDLRDTIY